MKIELDLESLEKLVESQGSEDRRRLLDEALRDAAADLASQAATADERIARERDARIASEDEARSLAGLLAQEEQRSTRFEEQWREERALRMSEATSAARARRKVAGITRTRNYLGAALLGVLAAGGLIFPVAFGLVNRPLGLTFLVFAAVLLVAVALSLAFRVRGLWKGLLALGGGLGLLVGIYEFFAALFSAFSEGR